MSIATLYDRTAILPVEYIEAFEKYIEGGRQVCAAGRDVVSIIDEILEELDPTISYSVPICVLSLLDFNQQLGTLLIHYPVEILPFLNEALMNVQKRRLVQNPYLGFLKPALFARLHNASLLGESIVKPNVSCLRSCDAGRLVVVRGTVVRTGQVKLLEKSRTYCCSKCQFKFKVYADLDLQIATLSPPTVCKSTGSKPCKSSTFTVVEEERETRDYQEIKIQEQVDMVDVGKIPRSISVILHDDLVDSSQPGQEVEVTGVLERRWRPLAAPVRADVVLVVAANALRLLSLHRSRGVEHREEELRFFDDFWRRAEAEGRQEAARKVIVSSVCSQLCGLREVKLALLLTLIGGVSRQDSSGMQLRGEIHCLLVGDPGLGKSQLLKWAARAAERGVLASGSGTSSAGLTVSATRDSSSGEWILEAGAVVLADGGVCCIDEFGAVRQGDRTTLHEAMEQQSISVAKAGLVCKLKTRCSIIAAMNPGSHDIASPLLSRFDLVLALHDKGERAWDKRVCDHLLAPSTPTTTTPSSHPAAPLPSAAAGAAGRRAGGEHHTDRPGGVVGREAGVMEGGGGGAGGGWGEPWGLQRLRTYIALVRRRLEPGLTAEAEELLTNYYQRQRTAAGRNLGRTTIRMLESLIRLAEAHARLMFRSRILLQDAEVAVELMEACGDELSGGAERSIFTKTEPQDVFDG